MTQSIEPFVLSRFPGRGVPGRSPLRLLAGCVLPFLLGCGASTADRRHRELTELYQHETPPAPDDRPAPDAVFAGLAELDRDTLVAAVLARNPDLDAAREGWRAALASYRRLGSLDDPQLSYAFAPLSIGSDIRYGQEIEVSQMFPFPGKLGLAEESAVAGAEAAFQDYQVLRLDLAAMASKLFNQYYLVDRSLDVNTEHRRLLDEYFAVATSRYRAGTAGQDEPLRAEVEATHLEHRELELLRTRRVIQAELNALLHRNPEDRIPPAPDSLPLPDPGPLDAEAVRDTALAARPELRAKEAQIRGYEASLRLAGRESYPDFGVMASYSSMWMDPDHQWMVGVRINLPLNLGRRDGQREEAQAHLSRARSERLALEDAVSRDVLVASSRLHEQAHIIELYRSRLLPASRDQAAAARTAFEADRTIFLTLIDAERNLRNVELTYEEALTSYHDALTELSRAAGRLPIPEGATP